MPRSNLALISLVALLFCTSNSKSAFSDEYANIHSVAVISVMVDSLDMNTYGITIFGSDFYRVRTDWNGNSLISDEVTKILSDRFVVKKMSASLEELSKIESIAKVRPSEYEDVAEQFVRSMPRSNGIDAYVIVMPKEVAAGSSLGGRYEIGQFGTRVSAISGPHIRFGAFYYVGVYDAATGKQIDWGSDVDSAVEECASETWATKEDLLSPEQKSRIHQEIFSLISRSIPLSLSKARLIDDEAAKVAVTKFMLPGDPSCHEPHTVW